MKNIAIALVLVILLAGCATPLVLLCLVPGKWNENICGGPTSIPIQEYMWVDEEGRVYYTSGLPPSRVPGEYIVILSADAEAKVKAIADLYGRFGIKRIKDLGLGLNPTLHMFLVILTEDPGPETMWTLRRDNAQFFSVQPNYVYQPQKSGSVR